MLPKLSIITVCLNNINGLKLTANSIEQQIFTDFEWIVIDGKSNDGTQEFLNNYKKNKMTYVSELDSGIYDAMNKGINLSKGDYLLFLNSGDYLYNSRVLLEISKQLDCDLIIGGLLTIFPNQNNKKPKFRNVSIKDINQELIYNKSLPHPSSFFSKKLFEIFGLYDTKFKISGDYDFYARILSHNISIKFLDLCVSVFSADGISSIMKNSDLLLEEHLMVKRKNFSKLYRFKRLLIDKFSVVTHEVVKKIS